MTQKQYGPALLNVFTDLSPPPTTSLGSLEASSVPKHKVVTVRLQIPQKTQLKEGVGVFKPQMCQWTAEKWF